MSSLKRNILANYASQVYVTLIGIVMVPVYIKYLGAEIYGLVGFFSMLQAWFNVLDLGLTPTIARESARFFGGGLTPTDYRRLYRSLSVIFAAVALVGGGILFALAPAVAGRWLQVRELPVVEVVAAVQIMAASVAMRWMGGLYRGVITGAERLVFLGGFSALIATLRFVGVFASMMVWGFTSAVFFWHQLAVAAIELAALFVIAQQLVPQRTAQDPPTGWSFTTIRPLMQFAMTIAFTSSVWVLATQTDKLVLSGILPLAEYGYFTLAVLVAGGITIISSPISMAIMPRMARLHAEGKHEEVKLIYNQSSQLVSVIAGSLAITLIVCADSLLFAWTGNRELTNATAPILRLYAVGNGLLALGAFPYYLQYARGNLRYHLIGNIMLAVLLTPSIMMAATKAGGVGAGWVWVAMNTLYLIFWVGYVHSKLEPGLHRKWLVSNLFVILLPTLLVGLILSRLQFDVHGRVVDFVRVVTIAIVCILVATMASPTLRPTFLQAIRGRLSWR